MVVVLIMVESDCLADCSRLKHGMMGCILHLYMCLYSYLCLYLFLYLYLYFTWKDCTVMGGGCSPRSWCPARNLVTFPAWTICLCHPIVATPTTRSDHPWISSTVSNDSYHLLGNHFNRKSCHWLPLSFKRISRNNVWPIELMLRTTFLQHSQFC